MSFQMAAKMFYSNIINFLHKMVLLTYVQICEIYKCVLLDSGSMYLQLPPSKTPQKPTIYLMLPDTSKFEMKAHSEWEKNCDLDSTSLKHLNVENLQDQMNTLPSSIPMPSFAFCVFVFLLFLLFFFFLSFLRERRKGRQWTA